MGQRQAEFCQARWLDHQRIICIQIGSRHANREHFRDIYELMLMSSDNAQTRQDACDKKRTSKKKVENPRARAA